MSGAAGQAEEDDKQDGLGLDDLEKGTIYWHGMSWLVALEAG